ncbi:MAG TPA: CBS domain-containing protein [Thermoplasmata archaeon]|jgi:CBS domain-containing protein|nr:CBS domain-containing protein [Thermoplasmata archaeon]
MPKLRLRDLKVRDFMSRDVVTGTADEPVTEILGRMKANNIHEIPILEKKKLAGIVSMAAIARHKSVQPTTKAQHLLQKAPEVLPALELTAAAEMFLSSGARTLPVTEKGKLVGILSRSDVVRALAQCEEIEGMTVADVMTPQPQCVAEKETVAQARTVMAGLGERAIPVVDEKRRLVGVVGLKDLTDLFARPKEKTSKGDIRGEKDPVKVTIQSIMRPPVTTKPEETLPKALERMVQNRISTVIAVENDEPIGIITTADVVEVAARFREREGLLVQISGLEEQPDVYDSMYDIIQKSMERINHLVSPRLLNLHVVQYKAEGDRSKWSLRARFATEHQMYHLKHFDWDLFKALNGMLDQLEALIKKEKERRITDRKRHHAS